MSKNCKNCGETLDDNATFCFKCKKNPDEVVTPEQETQIQKNEKNKKTVKTVITIAVIAALIVGVIFIIKGCTDIHREVKIGSGSVKLTDVVQDGTTVTLKFETKGSLELKDLSEFARKIKVDECELENISYELSGWSSNGGGSIKNLEVIFKAPQGYQISDGKIHF